MLKRVAALDIPMCVPVEFGICDDGVYALHSWIDGEDLRDVLPRLSETEQYVLGLKSGEILRKIHTLPAPDTQEEWESRFNKKTNRRIKTYQEYKARALTSMTEEYFLNYVESNRKLLKNRPQCFQHGDYHDGNMMIKNGELIIIDFDHYDFGDPWDEFNRITFSASASPYFATGQLRGYFGGEPPPDFFKLLMFYISSNQLGAVGWAHSFGESEMEFAKKQNEEVLRWFDNMNNPVPTWYLKDFYMQWIDGIPYKLKEPYDFSFLSEYGKVFKVFDEQASGCICFGVSDGEHKYFIKFAGVKTINNYDLPVSDAIARLKAAVIKYKELAHPLLIHLIKAKEAGGGYMLVFDWFDGESFSNETPLLHEKFTALPVSAKHHIFDEVLNFHAHVAKCGYVAMDFNDYSTLYNFERGEVKICDIDFYAKQSYINGMSRALGDEVIMSPEEFRIGGLVDEISNIYTMGATAFRIFSTNDRDRSPEAWTLNTALYNVAKKAVSDEREQRQQSIVQLIEEWRAAKCESNIKIPQRELYDISGSWGYCHI
jgi:serine/threonine-protein kinase